MHSPVDKVKTEQLVARQAPYWRAARMGCDLVGSMSRRAYHAEGQLLTK
jgi:hypothetical protein